MGSIWISPGGTSHIATRRGLATRWSIWTRAIDGSSSTRGCGGGDSGHERGHLAVAAFHLLHVLQLHCLCLHLLASRIAPCRHCRQRVVTLILLGNVKGCILRQVVGCSGRFRGWVGTRGKRQGSCGHGIVRLVSLVGREVLVGLVEILSSPSLGGIAASAAVSTTLQAITALTTAREAATDASGYAPDDRKEHQGCYYD